MENAANDVNAGADKKKRLRSVNFTINESRLLVEEVCKRKRIIENKQTDAVTCKQKEDAWNSIQSTFNANNGSNYRSTKTLKIKYEGIKRNLKQKRSREKCGMYRTGGGPPDKITYTDFEEKLLAILVTQVDGLPTQNDCDKDFEIASNPQQDIIIIELAQDVTTEPSSVAQIDGYEDSDNVAHTSKLVEDIAVFPLDQPDMVEAISTDVTATNASDSWQTWTPQTMKKPPHRALQQKSNRKGTLEQKFTNLANNREELVKLQSENV